MTSQQLSCQAPELVALCQVDDGGGNQVVGWAMLVADRVVAYVPEHHGVIGTGLLNTYSSLDAADRRLAFANIRPVRGWSALLDASPAQPGTTKP